MYGQKNIHICVYWNVLISSVLRAYTAAFFDPKPVYVPYPCTYTVLYIFRQKYMCHTLYWISHTQIHTHICIHACGWRKFFFRIAVAPLSPPTNTSFEFTYAVNLDECVLDSCTESVEVLFCSVFICTYVLVNILVGVVQRSEEKQYNTMGFWGKCLLLFFFWCSFGVSCTLAKTQWTT